MVAYPSILALHSERSLLESLELFLRQAGAGAITLCEFPEQAEKLLSREKFGLLLVQYRLDEGTGVEFIRKLRDRGEAMPVIILSRNPDSRAILETLALPHAEFLKVPFSLDQWEETVDLLFPQ